MKKLGKVPMLALVALLAGVLTIPFVFGQSAGAGQGSQSGDQQEKHFHGRGFGGRHGHGGWMGGRMFSRLNLTDAQKAQIKQINQNFRERTKTLRQDLRAQHQELRQSQTGASFNEQLATQKLTEMASLQAKLMGERFKLRQEVVAVLTPEQKAQLEQIPEQMKTRREQFKSKESDRRANQSE